MVVSRKLLTFRSRVRFSPPLPCIMKNTIKEILHKYNYNIPSNTKNITEDIIIDIICRDASLTKELGYSPGGLSNFLSRYFPDRPKQKCSIRSWLLSKEGLKICPYCELILPYNAFDNNRGKSDGKSSYCRSCNLLVHGKDYYTAYTAKRKALLMSRAVLPEQLKDIRNFYKNCPINFHVDHIIPLKHPLVSGLHVLANLQYLDAIENIKKANKFEVL